MSTFTFQHLPALRRFFAGLAAFVLLGVVSGTTAQPIIPGSYVTSLNWSTDGSLLAYSTGEIIPPWGESTQGGLARVIDLNGNQIFFSTFRVRLEMLKSVRPEH